MLAGHLIAALLLGVGTPAASAAGVPSVPLPDVPSTPVQKSTRTAPAQDQASASALSGNQPARAAQEGGGTATATSLSPSASWSVATHTGDFTWSYPLRVPPAPGGLQPDLALSYRSSAVDGRTSATNNQPSWVGDGWALSSGYVERTYASCAEDEEGSAKPTTGDLCWRSDNATASYGSGGGRLIRDDATGAWRAEEDDGSRVERLSGADNGDDNGEHWRITTVDGTQYHFGSDPTSASTWTVPVFGDDAGEPCNGASFAASRCTQAYRWNLDKIVDRNGNVIRYHYATETNSYGANRGDAAVPYVRGGTLARIDYGLREGVSQPSGRVLFAVADRCVPGSDCVQSKPDNWPDVPWDSHCAASTCAGKHAPTFFSTKRLASVTTQVRRGEEFTDVDRWDLDQQYPDPGDAEKAALWLKGVKHTGLVGGSAAATSMPSVTFEGTALPNRIATPGDGIAPLMRYRVTGVVSESGGITSVDYASECKIGERMPASPETNTLRCFPVRWAKKNFAERTDHFHKYVVARVTSSDRLKVDSVPSSTFAEQVTTYEYLDGAAWHWDTSEFTKAERRTWNEFRGFGRVRVRSGTPNDPSGPVTMTEQRFHRGMDGDKLPSGTRSVSVTDSEGGTRADADWLSGFRYETATFEHEGRSDQADPPRVSKVISTPSVQGPTATRGSFKAHIVRAGTQRRFTLLAAGGHRVTATAAHYDDRGLVTRVDDLGDEATAADDRCTRTEYARDEDKWLLSLPRRVQTVAVNCDEDAEFPADALADTRLTYDGNGNATKTEIARARPASGPEYVVTGTTAYDAHGRPTSSTDALGNTSKTAYTPAVGGPLTQLAVTGPPTAAAPAGMVVTTTLEPAWGATTLVLDANKRRTESVYDALGRKTAVWLPNRPRASNPTPSTRTAYLIRNDAPSAVSSTRIGPRGTEITATALYDGLLRPRQTQTPALGGGRLLTDTRYDSQGRAWKTTQPYFTDSAVDTELWVASDADVASHTRTLHDGAGRPTASVYFTGANEKWRTTTAYGGDRVHVTPPAGGTATTTVSDARGQMVELRHHHGPTPESGFDATKYTYTAAGRPATITDPIGAVWRFGYDLRGRKTTSESPDSGVLTVTYDDADRPVTQRDARGDTIAIAYDALGRVTGTFDGEVGGPKLTEVVYDTVAKGLGQLASATRWVGSTPYTHKVLTYNALYQPTGTSVVIPAAEGLLAGTYTSYAGYNPDGSSSSESFPAAGELPAETVNRVYHDLGPARSSSVAGTGPTRELATETEYTRYGEVARVHLGAGAKRVWQSWYYDAGTRRLDRTVVDAEVPTPMQSDVRYGYTPAGTITSIADAQPGAVDLQCFRMDGLRRLTEAWTPAEGCAEAPAVAGLSGPAPYWHSYTYDKVGSRETETRRDPSGTAVRTYANDVPGKPHALGSVSTAGGGVDTHAYDASGNLTARTVAGRAQEFTWDVQGALTAVGTEDGETSFVYDAAGNRLIRRAPDATTLYLGGQELRLAKAGGTPSVTRYYRHAGREVAVRQGAGAFTWLTSDHQSTAQIAIRSDTLQVTKRRQLPFGGPRGAAVFPGERGFVGGVKDASTGLTHIGARQYDPGTGRFISLDPLLKPTDPQQMHGYSYSDNNPITFSDPSGLWLVGGDDGHGGQYGYDADRGIVIGNDPNPSSYTPQPSSPSKPAATGWRTTGKKVSPRTVSLKDQQDTEIAPTYETWVIDDICGGDPGSAIAGDNLTCMLAYGQFQSAKAYRSAKKQSDELSPDNQPGWCQGPFNCVWKAVWKGSVSLNHVTKTLDQNLSRAGIDTTPDFVVVDASAFAPIGLAGAGVGASAGITVTSHGQVTLNAPDAPGMGSPGLSAGIRQGWIIGASDKESINGFVQGQATTADVYIPVRGPFGINGAVTGSGGDPSSGPAIELGLGVGKTPSWSVTQTYGHLWEGF
ncbi:RHS repeat-associated core domain-containing protein [Actinokineospora guangxiensis]|uniref:RHS repeat-associated core domain-containing protein n=1 Tax=Actinokineospora guangxiensis TaxID=1490288 RepID=A0ABW0EL78_9PSEU